MPKRTVSNPKPKILVTGKLATAVVTWESPVQTGLYLIFADPKVGIHTTRMLMLWINDRWCYPSSDQNYRGKVYGWLGPIPWVTVEA